MGFRDVIGVFRPETHRVLMEIWESGCIVFETRADGKTWYYVDYNKVPLAWLGVVRDMVGLSTAAILEAAVTTAGMCEGPKIIALNHLDAEALENMKVNLEFEDYDQPFSTIFVDMPVSFHQKHVVTCPQAGEKISGRVQVESHYPHSVGIRLVKNDKVRYMVVAVYFTSEQVYSALLDISVDRIIDDAIVKAFDPASMYTSREILPGTQEEHEAALAAIRVAMNTVLILEEEGMRRIGPRDPKHYKKLEDNLAKARKRCDPEEKQKKAAHILASEPIYYTFKQDVVLFTREEELGEVERDTVLTGRHLRSHWRRGYWRMQVFGAGKLQKKRIRIPPVMVNRGRFLGRDGDTTVTYTD